MKDKPLESLEESFVLVVEWKEIKGDLGRIAGCSLHLDPESCMRYAQEYWDGMPDQLPDEYEAPYLGYFPLSVSQEMYERIKESESGIRLSQPEYRALLPSGYSTAHEGYKRMKESGGEIRERQLSAIAQKQDLGKTALIG